MPLDARVQTFQRHFSALVGIGDQCPYKLHVLLRHRLLRQSHGFEGLLVAEIVEGPDYLSVANRDDRASGRFGRDPARLAAPPEPAKQHNAVVSHIAKPLRLELEVLKLSSIGVPEPPHPLVTLIEALGALD